jgi:hypothetical protein
MYRAPHTTLASTIERLESELREVRALRGPARPRERLLWAITTVSVLGAVFAGAALTAATAKADVAERKLDGVRTRLELKTQDLGACESVAFHALRGTQD